MITRLAVYDYCGTIVNVQTANEFTYEYAMNNLSWLRRCVAFLVCKNKIFKKNRKRVLLKLMTGEDESKINSFARYYANKTLQNKVNREVLDDLQDRKRQGFKVIIISAGYAEYIKQHNSMIGSDVVVANELLFKNGKFTGMLKEPDCYADEKVTRLKRVVDLHSVDMQKSVFFSDCMSDKPLFQLFGNRFFVRSGVISRLDMS